MALSQQAQASTLLDVLTRSDLLGLMEKQGSLPELNKRLSNIQRETLTYNREFNERYHQMGDRYKLPFFGTNQDILILGFYFSYAFLVLISLIIYYKNTRSFANVAYAFLGSCILLLLLTGVLLKVA